MVRGCLIGPTPRGNPLWAETSSISVEKVHASVGCHSHRHDDANGTEPDDGAGAGRVDRPARAHRVPRRVHEVVSAAQTLFWRDRSHRRIVKRRWQTRKHGDGESRAGVRSPLSATIVTVRGAGSSSITSTGRSDSARSGRRVAQRCSVCAGTPSSRDSSHHQAPRPGARRATR
jgi:hypothetical protein